MMPFEPPPPPQDRGKTYYCTICLVELNSEDTMTAHIKGSKHMEKVLEVQKSKEAQQG